MSTRRVLVGCLTAVLLAVGVSTVGPSVAASASLACARYTSDLHRTQDATGSGQLLTLDAGGSSAAPPSGFTQRQGVLARVSAGDGTGLSAVWRLRRSRDYSYAAAGRQLDALVSAGYVKEGVAFYASPEPRRCLTPVFRFQRGEASQLATRHGAAALTAAGWSRGPVAFHAVANPRTSTVAPVPTADTRFALAVIPDTQRELINAGDTRFANRIQWLTRNQAQLDLRYALQVGDLVDWGSVDPAQFTRASEQLRPLEASMPWAGAVGNHDTAAVCVGGSACPGADTTRTVRDTTAYNRAFPPARFADLRGTFEPGKVDNSYRTFSAGGAEWLVLALELWPRPGAVDWARSVVEGHPRHNVIVVTHDYLQGDGSIGGTNGGYGSTSPRYLFDNLIRVYPNIRLVLSGHVGIASVRTDVGVNGNKVLSLLQTFHSTTNPVRILEIDTAAGTATSTVYAPQSDTHYPAYRTATDGMSFVR
jgi:hypothetical protein